MMGKCAFCGKLLLNKVLCNRCVDELVRQWLTPKEAGLYFRDANFSLIIIHQLKLNNLSLKMHCGDLERLLAAKNIGEDV